MKNVRKAKQIEFPNTEWSKLVERPIHVRDLVRVILHLGSFLGSSHLCQLFSAQFLVIAVQLFLCITVAIVVVMANVGVLLEDGILGCRGLLTGYPVQSLLAD